MFIVEKMNDNCLSSYSFSNYDSKQFYSICTISVEPKKKIVQLETLATSNLPKPSSLKILILDSSYDYIL